MPRKKTQEETIVDFKEVWGDRFDFSKVKYINAMTKVEVVCKKHGSFFIRPRDLKKGRGCRHCFYDSLRSNTEAFIKKANNVFNFKYIYDKTDYVSAATELCITCPDHGDFFVVAADHLKGCGCKVCKNIKNGDRQRTPIKKVIKDFKDTHGDRYSYPNLKNKYKNAAIPIPIICDIHGEFLQSPANHIKGSNCPDCCLKNKGWTYSKWVKAGNESNNFDCFKLYIVRFSNGLYKIGRTFVTLKSRFSSIPLDYEIIDIIISEDGREICEIEILFQNLCVNYKQIPDSSFKGRHECYSSIEPLMMYLS